jgi:hypothetical protein
MDFEKQVKGNWSAMFKAYLQLQLFGPCGLATSGVPLTMSSGEPLLLFAKLSNVLADGEGLAKTYEWKGASSMKPCLKHWNVLKVGSGLTHHAGEVFVEGSCCDPAKFKSTTVRSLKTAANMVLAAADKFQEGLIDSTTYEDIEKAAGLSVTRAGLMASGNMFDAGILQAFTYDWMHTFLSDGCMNVEAFLLIVACERIGVVMEDLEKYFYLDWQFPKQFAGKGRQLYKVFQASRNSENKLKSSCSEMYGLYGLLRHFVETRIGDHPEVTAEIASFKACCRAVDTIKQAKRRALPMANASTDLRAAMSDHLRKHKALYGVSHLKPKHHWAFDVADQLGRDPVVLDMHITERLHLDVKRFAENVTNTTNFEEAVLSRKCLWQEEQLKQQQDDYMQTQLLGETTVFVGFENARMALHADACNKRISAGDIVCMGTRAGAVIACAMEDGGLFLLVREFAQTRRISEVSACWRDISARPGLWAANSIELALAWYYSDKDSGDLVILTDG